MYTASFETVSKTVLLQQIKSFSISIDLKYTAMAYLDCSDDSIDFNFDVLAEEAKNIVTVKITDENNNIVTMLKNWTLVEIIIRSENGNEQLTIPLRQIRLEKNYAK